MQRKWGFKLYLPVFIRSGADINVNCDPIELLAWFKGAQCVVTNTFHGCVLSIITGREMAVRLRGNANKLLNLMTEYKIENREFGNTRLLDDVFSTNVDWNAVNDQIKLRRASSMAYLKKMIEL